MTRPSPGIFILTAALLSLAQGEEFAKLYIGKVGDSANPKSSTRKSSFFRKKTLSKKGSRRTLSKKGSQKTPSRQGSFRGSSCETPRYPSFRSGGRTPSSGGTPSIGRGARTPLHPFIGMEDPTGGNTSGLIYREPQGVVMHDWRMPPWLYPPAENQNTFYLTCHSCWAFASLAAVEILVAEEIGGVVMLSKQDLVDCVQDCDGCEMGYLDKALEHLVRAGVSKAENYPYMAMTQLCDTSVARYISIGGFEEILSQEQAERDLYWSPIPTNMHVPVDSELHYYVSGVIDVLTGCSNDKDHGNHGVVIVGHYRDAWLLRNSWGPEWGLQGHFILKKGICGVTKYAYKVNGPFQRVVTQSLHDLY
ncbi:unnamed protein product [Bemisia tabaci]|uniref:Peptidase C1A papain C-terminal domain-containing protein n=1 Tax=Bemisia tabaci TaxID=7038 RepID=A0A9P0ANS2_BEMTA|nr:unnamed protein product [Bemisia tabaci]